MVVVASGQPTRLGHSAQLDVGDGSLQAVVQLVDGGPGDLSELVLATQTPAVGRPGARTDGELAAVAAPQGELDGDGVVAPDEAARSGQPAVRLPPFGRRADEGERTVQAELTEPIQDDGPVVGRLDDGVEHRLGLAVRNGHELGDGADVRDGLRGVRGGGRGHEHGPIVTNAGATT